MTGQPRQGCSSSGLLHKYNVAKMFVRPLVNKKIWYFHTTGIIFFARLKSRDGQIKVTGKGHLWFENYSWEVRGQIEKFFNFGIEVIIDYYVNFIQFRFLNLLGTVLSPLIYAKYCNIVNNFDHLKYNIVQYYVGTYIHSTYFASSQITI